VDTVDNASAITIACVPVAAARARHLAETLAEEVEGVTAVAAFDDGVQWWIELQFGEPPDECAVRTAIARLLGDEAAGAARFETIAAQDWVAASLAGLKPVEAGRFILHGAHDRMRIAPNRIAIEIEAALAFGTGHHATTRGCLLALEYLHKLEHFQAKWIPVRRPKMRPHKEKRAKSNSIKTGFALAQEKRRRAAPARRSSATRLRKHHKQAFLDEPTNGGSAVTRRFNRSSPRKRGPKREQQDSRLRGNERRKVLGPGARGAFLLDVGTGTGVLAIAAAKIWRRRVLASDIDGTAVRIARDNAKRNGERMRVRVIEAAGVYAGAFRRQAPYPLIAANILLEPLKRMAAPLARLVAPGGRIILSGVLADQADAALAAYRSQGLRLACRITLKGWVTLILARDARAVSAAPLRSRSR
jgi:ribosomal protein L11 methylase PrmA